MKVIMLSLDASIFDEASAFRARAKSYAQLFDQLVIIAPSKTRQESIREGNLIIEPARARSLPQLFISMWRTARRNIRYEDRDAYITTSQEEFTGLLCFFLKRKYGIPWCAQMHSDTFGQFFAKHSVKNMLRRVVARATLGAADGVRVVSDRVEKNTRRVFGGALKIYILPIAVDLSVFFDVGKNHIYAREEGRDFCFLAVSRLAPEKNIQGIISAFSQVLKQYPATILRIVGEGIDKSLLEKQVASLDLESRVFFEGQAAHARDVADYCKEADCYVLNSWHEGYSISVLEAAAAGLPVIMTDVGVAGDTIKNSVSGLVVSPGDQVAIERAMLTMRSMDAGAREKMGRAASTEVKSISQEEYLTRFKEILSLCKN